MKNNFILRQVTIQKATQIAIETKHKSLVLTQSIKNPCQISSQLPLISNPILSNMKDLLKVKIHPSSSPEGISSCYSEDEKYQKAMP